MQRICNFHRQNGPTHFILQPDPLETRGFLHSIQNRKLKSRFEGFAPTRSNTDATRNYVYFNDLHDSVYLQQIMKLQFEEQREQHNKSEK